MKIWYCKKLTETFLNVNLIEFGHDKKKIYLFIRDSKYIYTFLFVQIEKKQLRLNEIMIGRSILVKQLNYLIKVAKLVKIGVRNH